MAEQSGEGSPFQGQILISSLGAGNLNLTPSGSHLSKEENDATEGSGKRIQPPPSLCSIEEEGSRDQDQS